MGMRLFVESGEIELIVLVQAGAERIAAMAQVVDAQLAGVGLFLLHAPGVAARLRLFVPLLPLLMEAGAFAAEVGELMLGGFLADITDRQEGGSLQKRLLILPLTHQGRCLLALGLLAFLAALAEIRFDLFV